MAAEVCLSYLEYHDYYDYKTNRGRRPGRERPVKLLGDTSVWSLALRRKDAGSLSHDEQELKAQLAQAIQRAELTNAAAGQQDAIGKFQTIIGRRSHHRAGPPDALRTGSKDNIGLR